MQNKVRELREGLGWSQERLAQAVGTHRNTVSGWEKGGDIKSSNLMQLVALFGVDVNAVLGLPGDDEVDKQAAGFAAGGVVVGPSLAEAPVPAPPKIAHLGA